MNLKISQWVKLAPVFQKRIISFALVVAPLFSLIAIAQILFVRHEIQQPIIAEQKTWADEITEQIAYTNKWDLDGYRNAIINAPGWIVIASNGFVIDVEQFIPGLLPHVSLLDTSEVGERWHLFKKKLDGGLVVVGTRTQGNENDIEQKLEQNAGKFGLTLTQAIEQLNGGTRNIDNDVDFAVFDNSGELINAIGGIPMKLEPTLLQRFSGRETEIRAGNKIYSVFSVDVLDSKNKPVAKILIPTDVTFVKKAFHVQVWFNIWMVAILWMLVVLLSVPFLQGAIKRQQRLASLKDELRNASLEESHTVEFKRAFQWDFQNNQQNKELRLHFFLKPVCAFLNSAGGTLLIGVNDDGKICGINKDLNIKGSTDKLEQEMMQLLSANIGTHFSHFVQIQFEQIDRQDKELVCIVNVEPASRPAFVKWNTEIYFFKRAGNKSEPLNPREQHDYIQTKWS